MNPTTAPGPAGRPPARSSAPTGTTGTTDGSGATGTTDGAGAAGAAGATGAGGGGGATGAGGGGGSGASAARPATDATRAAAARLERIRRRGLVRRATVSGVLLAVVLAAFALSLSTGDFVIPLADVLATLAGGGDTGTRFVVLELRLPRALLALLVGACFGLSGAVFQSLLRNPLAGPDVIGVSAGASAAAVVATMVLGLSGIALSGLALLGALLTGAAVYLLAWRKGVTGHRLVLVGIGIGAGLSSVVSYVMTRSDVTEAQGLFLWLTGSLNGRSWAHFWPLLGGAALLVPLTLLTARALPALQLGDETAGGLGARVEPGRLAMLACATALAGLATAAAGPVGFVAFVCPSVARRLLPGHGAALVPSALVGAALVLLADYAAQHLVPGTQLPVGIVTSLVGAPYLLWLLARADRAGRGGRP